MITISFADVHSYQILFAKLSKNVIKRFFKGFQEAKGQILIPNYKTVSCKEREIQYSNKEAIVPTESR